MKKALLVSISLFAFSFYAFAQNINIPDDNFKNYLLGRTDSINTDADQENISVQEAEAFSGTIIFSNGSTTSLAGIEAFVNLKYLQCVDMSLTSLDVSKNTSLLMLTCSRNQITTLDVSNNTALTILDCGQNKLSSLDVRKNTNLVVLNFESNLIPSLDISQNLELTTLSSGSNPLSALDISENVKLKYLVCYDNNLSNLDLSKAPDLVILNAFTNQLTSLDLTHQTKLTQVVCYDNQLTDIDASSNPDLILFIIYQNQFATLDVSKNLALSRMICTGNSSLFTICISPSQVSSSASWSKDATAAYSTVCSGTVGVADDLLKSKNREIYKIYNVQGQEVDRAYEGLVIYKYTDGSSQKFIQQ